ncbi:MAG: acylneuraminate cytidylyltransferase family protein [Alphaproteobacteria bacterium]|uniref:Acylneuraminate cytidylyltransferase family protein n=1 Tax=Candidatus Nitrobium versatile TaxID=2884831 RepID=A0A953M1K8_9BACT|nr:acylneuraminate cytidylyltransferase family protein [Candidatus Nitrobium versatile]
MYKNNRIVCIIPARGGSKGVLRKNIKILGGKPLIAYTIEQALQSQYIDRTIVSTDDKEIVDVSQRYGAEVPFIRPDDLGGDHVATIDVLLHAIFWLEEHEKYDFDILVLLHATTPLRSITDIDACIEILIETKADNVFSVTEAHRNPYFNMVEIGDDGIVTLVKKGDYATRQSAPKVYDMNASIYVWWKNVLKNERTIFLKKSHIYVMPKERSVDIDDDLDFRIAEFLWMNRQGGA